MATNPKLLRGVVPPVCTPFTSDYEVDEKSLRRLVNHLIDGGVHGLFVLGSTSEVAYLTDKRRADVIRIAIDETAGRVPVVAGAIDMPSGCAFSTRCPAVMDICRTERPVLKISNISKGDHQVACHLNKGAK